MAEKLLIVYFGINGFIAGYYYADQIGWAHEKGAKIMVAAISLSLFLFGAGALPTYFMIKGLGFIYQWLNTYIQLSFWFQFYFGKTWNNPKRETLELMARGVKEVRNTNSIRDRIYRYWY